MNSGDTTLASILFFFTLFAGAQAKLKFHPTDYKAAISVLGDLGVYSQRSGSQIESESEWRVSEKSSVLRFIAIVFKSQKLDGKLSPALGKLSELTELSLPDNDLYGPIPDTIAGCRKLEILNLRNNRFSGEVPRELSKLVNLRELDLSRNNFTGDLDFIKSFPNLKFLSIGDNMFVGNIPDSALSLPNVTFFEYSDLFD